ncbi:glycosyltransferase [Belliella sp. DSM 111904]|uniref:Glycosyltransferase n=1 Tax=Belliella filtrata TaxID=2923435 RepID=A0ABS9UXJ1_9BACT|nr:glycosyltransferase [Belliella filtrata]MCH7408654.1 glycosyltransferase [Belliella filtrata]
MKILYLIDTLQTGGAERSLLEIASGLRGFEAVFITVYKDTHALHAAYEGRGVSVIHLDFPKGTPYSHILPTLKEHIAILRPDLVHATLYNAEMLSRRLGLRVPLINSLVNNSYHKRRYAGLTWKGRLALLRVQVMDYLCKGKVDMFVANSSYISQVHQRYLGIPSAKIQVIHRGRSITSQSDSDPIEIQKIRSSLPRQDTKVWLTVGRLIRRKGHNELIQAFHRHIQKYPNAVLWILGEGEEHKRLDQLIEDLNLQEHVFLLGNQSNVVSWLGAADFFVFPSHYEGLPGVLIEAMISKLPIIVSDIPENRECLQEGMAIFHQVGDVADLANQLENALAVSDWDLRTNKAFEYAKAQFNIKKVVQQYEDLYQKMING